MKQTIYNRCLFILNQKIEELQLALNAATEAANNETKSSAGDKHETARAMMQLEQEKITKQLNDALDQKAELTKIDTSKLHKQITKGSLVESDKGFIFLSIGLGKITVNDQFVFVVSPQSPLGEKLIGLKENEVATLNNASYLIKTIS